MNQRLKYVALSIMILVTSSTFNFSQASTKVETDVYTLGALYIATSAYAGVQVGLGVSSASVMTILSVLGDALVNDNVKERELEVIKKDALVFLAENYPSQRFIDFVSKVHNNPETAHLTDSQVASVVLAVELKK